METAVYGTTVMDRLYNIYYDTTIKQMVTQSCSMTQGGIGLGTRKVQALLDEHKNPYCVGMKG